MDKLHFDDPTKITCPLGLLLKETRDALRKWPHGWEFFSHNGEWVLAPHPAVWQPSVTYRARPAPLTQDVVPWASTAKKFKWYARCGNREDLGRFYIQQPRVTPTEVGWYSVHHSVSVMDFGGDYTMGTVDWRDSLQQRPEGV